MSQDSDDPKHRLQSSVRGRLAFSIQQIDLLTQDFMGSKGGKDTGKDSEIHFPEKGLQTKNQTMF